MLSWFDLNLMCVQARCYLVLVPTKADPTPLLKTNLAALYPNNHDSEPVTVLDIPKARSFKS